MLYSCIYGYTNQMRAKAQTAKKKATFNMDASLHQRLKITAATTGREMVDIVQEALEAYLKKTRKLA